MEFTLEKIRPGDWVIVTEIEEDCPLKNRFQEFGFVVDSLIFCPFISPGGDLTALELGGTVIAVRVKDLTGIRVRRC